MDWIVNRVAVHLYTLCTIQALLRHAMGDEKYSVGEILGNARGLLTPSSVILLMQINLLLPFQTDPAAVHIHCGTRQWCKVVAIISTTVSGT